MIIVFPHAYHSGFNHGFNMAESTNFALPRWIEYAKRFRGCLCGDKDNEVAFKLDPFIKKYQPERYMSWSNGEDFDLHPEDPEFLRKAYNDAKLRLSPGDLNKFKAHVKARREIPDWFLKSSPPESYKDKIDLFRYYDLSAFVEDWTEKKTWSPRHRAALRNLLENPESCKVKVKPLGSKVFYCSNSRNKIRAIVLFEILPLKKKLYFCDKEFVKMTHTPRHLL